MEKDLEKVFLKAKYEEKPDLTEHIWQNIVLRNKRNTRFKLWAFSILAIVSFSGLVPAIETLLSDLTQSGLYEYLSLALSNGNSLILYWKEFGLSIAESLPTMSITISLSLVFILFLSLKNTAKQIIKNELILTTSF